MCSPQGNQIANYTGGSGTLNDGLTVTDFSTDHLFVMRLGDDGLPIQPEITPRFADPVFVDRIVIPAGSLPSVTDPTPARTFCQNLAAGPSALSAPIRLGESGSRGRRHDRRRQRGGIMKVDELMGSARDLLTVKKVYGEPYEKAGLTVIPAAAIRGGAGGGTGRDEKGQEGEGAGFGMSGSPAGAYVVKDGKVTWLPAVNPNRIFLMVGLAVVVYLLMRPRMARVRLALSGSSPLA
jgi:uncharacterized spore protein YtfJ